MQQWNEEAGERNVSVTAKYILEVMDVVGLPEEGVLIWSTVRNKHIRESALLLLISPSIFFFTLVPVSNLQTTKTS